MICDDLIVLWRDCIKEVRKSNETAEEKKTKKKLIIFIIVVAVIMAGIEIGLFLSYSAQNDIMTIIFLIAGFVFAIVSIGIANMLDNRPAPKERLSKRTALYTNALNRFENEAGFRGGSLEKMRPILYSWIEGKRKGRDNLLNRIYSVCISGIFVSGILSLVKYANNGSTSLALELTLLLCGISLFIALIAGPSWELNDLRKKNSLDTALDLRNALEFKDMFKPIADDALSVTATNQGQTE